MLISRIARTAVTAGATAFAYWAFNTLLAKRKSHVATARKADVKAAVLDWENEGGAVKPLSGTRTS